MGNAGWVLDQLPIHMEQKINSIYLIFKKRSFC